MKEKSRVVANADTSTSSVELQNDEECDATKMLREQKLVPKDCFGFASQDDSSNLPAGRQVQMIKNNYLKIKN